jgi:hypothetical protein
VHALLRCRPAALAAPAGAAAIPTAAEETAKVTAAGTATATAVTPVTSERRQLPVRRGRLAHGGVDPLVRAVALQVAFERQTLKPVFQLIGYRLWV